MISTILLTCDYSPCSKAFPRAVWQVSSANFCSPTCYRAERKSRQASISFADRFWSKVDKTPGHGPQGVCWLWTGATHANGYGNFRATPYKEGNVSAHIVSFFLKTGAWPPDGLFVLHACDTRRCVNNEVCLFLGTHMDNMQDMITKGRQGYVTHPNAALRGERHHNSKLTDTQWEEILTLLAEGFMTKRSIAARYGISTDSLDSRLKHQR